MHTEISKKDTYVKSLLLHANYRQRENMLSCVIIKSFLIC